jgi:intracellular septation protein A
MNSFLVWFGILPVAVFLALGGRGRERLALWGALALGALEAGYSIAVAGGIDYLTVATFLIMAVFIGVSLRTHDDFFFKIHGAVTNLATAAVMLFAWFVLHKAMLLDAADKYIGLDKLAAMNPEMDQAQLGELFRVLSLHLPVWMILHAFLTIHAARNWGRWAWALVYIPGLFVAFILAVVSAQAAMGR